MPEPIDDLRAEVIQKVLAIASWLSDEQLSYLLDIAACLWEGDPAPRVSVEDVGTGRHPG